MIPGLRTLHMAFPLAATDRGVSAYGTALSVLFHSLSQGR